MTGNQIRFAEHTENVRHNRATEVETRRSNVARETETHRSNIAHEIETNRHNVATETESKRHNVATEAENKRHNVQQENIGYINANAATKNAQSNAIQAAAAERDSKTRQKSAYAQDFKNAAQGLESLGNVAEDVNDIIQSWTTPAGLLGLGTLSSS